MPLRSTSFKSVPLQAVAEQIPLLVQGVRGSQAQPDSPSAQLALIAASQSFLQVRCPFTSHSHHIPFSLTKIP